LDGADFEGGGVAVLLVLNFRAVFIVRLCSLFNDAVTTARVV
jgi:hypothetical protein